MSILKTICRRFDLVTRWNAEVKLVEVKPLVDDKT